ncbi:MAG: hypothetical protein U0572_14250 [Phycisphaerales bacterium]
MPRILSARSWSTFVAHGSLVGLSLVAVTSTASAQNLSVRMAEVARQRQTQASQDPSKATLLGALLYTDISCDFKSTKAKDAIDYIATSLGVPVVARYNTDRSGAGIDPDTDINLKVESKPALSVLEMVLEQCSTDEPCTWQLRESFIEVGTKGRLSVPAARELKMYPIRDLIFEAPMFDNAPNFNLNQAIQQGNNGNGGGNGGGGGGFGGGGGGFGGGGGGGGFGGGGGGGGGGSGGGIFGDPGDAPQAVPEEERAQKIVDLILETVEPDAWADNGGDIATIRYHQGVLIVRAPDYIQRQIGGYPFAARARTSMASAATAESRYVTFTAPLSIIQNTKFRPQIVTGATGGGNGGGTSNPSPPAPPTGGNGTGGSPPTKPSTPPAGGK